MRYVCGCASGNFHAWRLHVDSNAGPRCPTSAITNPFKTLGVCRMKIKLRYSRNRASLPVDLLVSTDASTSVGALADFLARADPESDGAASGTCTLRLAGSGGTEINPDIRLLDSDILSGCDVEMAQFDGVTDVLSSNQVAAVVVVVSGPDAGKEFPLRAGVSVIGRGRDCDIRLSDPMTSREHARIHVGELVEISDLGSVNGVLVGDVPAESAVLRAGETARLGDTVITTRLLVRIAGAPGLPAASDFNRPPLVDVRYSGRNFPLPDIPNAPKGQRFPIIPLFAPLLMGAALYLSTKSTTSLIFMAMSPLMMAGNVVEGQLFGKRNYRRELEEYHASVNDTKSEVAAEAEREVRARQSEYPSMAACADAIGARGPLLWSRRPDLPGFSELCLAGEPRSRGTRSNSPSTARGSRSSATNSTMRSIHLRSSTTFRWLPIWTAEGRSAWLGQPSVPAVRRVHMSSSWQHSTHLQNWRSFPYVDRPARGSGSG